MVRAIRMKAIRLPCNGPTEGHLGQNQWHYRLEASAAMQWEIPAQPFTRTLAFALVRNLRPRWN